MGRLLVVTADDFGLTVGTSEAIVEAHRSGIVTATSVLGNGPATTRTLALLDDAPGLEVGVHVALVGEDPPVSRAADIPTLVDRRGRLAHSWRILVPRLAVGRVDPADVRRELEAQVALVRAGGRRLTHLNLHQHLQLWPSLRDVVVDAGVRLGIGFVRTPRSARRGPIPWGVRSLAAGLATAIEANGCATSDGFLGLDEAGAWNGLRFRRAVATVEGAVVEANVHPGPTNDPHRHRYGWGYRWGEELAALTDPLTRDAVVRAGFRLVGPSGVAVAMRESRSHPTG